MLPAFQSAVSFSSPRSLSCSQVTSVGDCAFSLLCPKRPTIWREWLLRRPLLNQLYAFVISLGCAAGMESYAVREFAEALEVIPYTLAENAGLNPIHIVSQLRSLHAQGQRDMGINVKKGTVTNMREQKVVQPLLVTKSALELATEAVRMILKIDDIVMTR